jgi:hypothetical protein
MTWNKMIVEQVMELTNWKTNPSIKEGGGIKSVKLYWGIYHNTKSSWFYQTVILQNSIFAEPSKQYSCENHSRHKYQLQRNFLCKL